MLPDDWRRYLAPAAFLLAATIAVVLVRAGFEAGGHGHGGTPSAGSPSGGGRAVATTTATTAAKPPAKKRFWVVRAGDTFAVISARTGVPVATIARLNPTAHSTSLFIGERIRLK